MSAEQLRARHFIKRMHEVAGPYTGRRTAVLYGKNWLGVPKLLGTCVPVIAGGLKFLLTAAHTLDTPLLRKRGVYVSPGVQGGKLVSLHECAVEGSLRPQDGDRINDAIDLRVIRLTDDAIAQIGPGIEFVRLGEFDVDDGRPGTYYFLHGFPSRNVRINLVRRTIRSSSFPYGTIAYRGERGTWTPYDPAVHIDLDFDPEKNVDDDGRPVRPPSPAGISGCGIWRLFDGTTPSSSWSESDIRLVGIEHRWERTKHILRGTRIVYASQILYRKYDSCRLEMDRLWGRMPH